MSPSDIRTVAACAVEARLHRSSEGGKDLEKEREEAAER